ncbi:hypothetical protein HY605_04525 [Candidatus Peregrinibacteria bacterium]|nr:hypothetical protein [Candidatus Peregrinibacteria bacterium]
MRFKADLHLHTDYDEERGRRHGDKPENIAGGIVESGLDVFAITEHNAVSERFFDVCDEVERLTEGTGREVLGLLGTEMTVVFEGHRYHIGYVYEGTYGKHNLPEVPDPRVNLRDMIEQYQVDYPGIVILNHPTWKDGHGIRGKNNPEVTMALVESGLVDGVEILNGSILFNGADLQISRSAVEMFLAARAKGHRLAAIGCSDAHRGINHENKSLVGSCATEFTSATRQGLFHEIKGGNSKAVALEPTTVRKRVQTLIREVRGAGRYLSVFR